MRILDFKDLKNVFGHCFMTYLDLCYFHCNFACFLHRLCLSITDFHPDTWNPAWSVSTILTGLLSFMVEKGPTLGSIETSDYTVVMINYHKIGHNQQPLILQIFDVHCTFFFFFPEKTAVSPKPGLQPQG